MGREKPASSFGVMAHLFALYGWMSWHFWNHIAAAVLWTLGVLFVVVHFTERMKERRE